MIDQRKFKYVPIQDVKPGDLTIIEDTDNMNMGIVLQIGWHQPDESHGEDYEKEWTIWTVSDDGIIESQFVEYEGVLKVCILQ